MRHRPSANRRQTLRLALAGLLLLTAGCSNTVAGTAQPDPHEPGTAVTEDGYGIRIGFPDAPVQIEVFTEPQCPHCADLQADFGPDFARYIGLGQLAVTYRPVTFFDDGAGGHSTRVSNAMFLAVGPDTSGPEFQEFVESLWAQHDSGDARPSDAELAEMASRSGVGAAEVSEITDGATALDVAEMDALNSEYLWEIDPVSAGTPTVYDLAQEKKLDVYDDNWLAKLMMSA